MYINDELKHELKKAFAPVSRIKEVALFDAISPKKLKNATKSYAPQIGSDETIIALYDSTVFGSAKEGFLLTTKRLYSKDLLEKATEMSIEEIVDIFVGGSPYKIEVQGEYGAMNINAIDTIGPHVHRALCQAVELLGGFKSSTPTVVESASSNQEVRCTGCGSTNNGNAKFCEYCGAALSSVTVSPSDEHIRYDVILTALDSGVGSDKDLRELLAMEVSEYTGQEITFDALPKFLKKAATKAEVDDLQNILGAGSVLTFNEVIAKL
jgi:hypothetical protein